VTAPTDRADGAPTPPEPAGPSVGVKVAAAVGVLALVVLTDQVTKSWAVDRLSRGPVHVIGPLDLVLAYNTGASFSLFTGATGVVTAVAAVLAAVLVVLAIRAPTTGRAAVYGLILGGALGNLFDRLFRDHHGAVVDFVDLRVWPTFNVADSAIVVGCLLLAASLILGGRHRDRPAPAPEPGGDAPDARAGAEELGPTTEARCSDRGATDGHRSGAPRGVSRA
jgi:signal peptidase II